MWRSFGGYLQMRKKTSKIKIFRIVAWVLLVLQLFSYVGNLNQKNKVNAEPAEMLGYYIGINFFLIISLVLFFIDYRRQRKAKRALLEEQINEIGKQA
ncbi:hypothetical protein [Flavihumibacter cheonanensis]|uniref:hypothetical protein n=1 Tax=Flavihumibacter cheonanensis TaxID=1442385 RepID=UPI001EF7BD23|nr:hypothetical protein [Flavihumibacter cheonanensis]MCG7754196.1 hypothetical protein [Flavihumibacter cheonanensis]